MSLDRAEGRRYIENPAMAALLGLSYLVVGIAFVYSVVTDSTDLLMAVLAAILVIGAISLVIVFRHEGVVTPENKVIGAFVVVAVALLVVLSSFTALPRSVVWGVVFGVGVIAPAVYVEYRR